MSTDNKHYNKYARAKRRVTALKGFRNHIVIFVFINLMVLAGRYIVVSNLSTDITSEPGFINWLNLNTYLMPGLWAIVLIIHGLIVNGKLHFFKKWEERKIKEFMEEDREKPSN